MVLVLDPIKTDEELAAEAAREDSDGPAFTELVGRHQERVWRLCYRLMGNDHDAGDAAQEVFVGLFQNRGTFAGRSKFATWLHAIAVRTCLKLRRARGRRHRYEASMAERAIHGVRETADTTGQALDLTQMLETLDEEDRALLVLKYSEDYSYEELAEVFHLSVSACKMRVSRARDALQARFPDHEL
ncbi:MAG: sigma-70 family RNA polymerase sigma factor [Planctomycetia bacterium]|nr:sigma-70 family RNA polymerase sigma factor [Planctomycetia bacterium]